MYAQVEVWKPQISRQADGGQWHVFVPLWPLAIGTAVLPTVWAIRRRKSPVAGKCPNCGYDLRATPARCPECGTVPAAPLNHRS